MILTSSIATTLSSMLLLCVAGSSSAPQDAETSTATAEERPDPIGLAPKMAGEELERRAAESYRRGLAYLLPLQNADGSWGSHVPVTPGLKDFGFGTTSRGSNDGVRIACTAIIATALLHDPHRSELADAALERAIDALVRTEPIAYDMGEAFNTWGYGYRLAFLDELYEHPLGAELEGEIRAAAKVCIKGLLRFQQADGGWNYYASPMANGESMSFNTAVFTAALARAEHLGFDVPEGMVDDALALLRRMVTVKGSALYDARFIVPSVESSAYVNDLSSGSRTAAVIEAFAATGRLLPDDLRLALKVFDEGENWLEDGRKHIQPHAGVHQIAGYFFFFGYYYHSSLLRRAGSEVTRERWDRDAWTMIRTQEDCGSWWDTPAAQYGDKWGTGFALLVLQAYLEHAGALGLLEESATATEPEGIER